MNNNLFRKEALEHQKSRLWGDQLQLNPVSSWTLSTLVIAISLGSIIFLLNNTYSRKEVVQGHVSTDLAAIEVKTSSPGRIISLQAELGDQVQAGDELFDVQVDGASRDSRFYSEELLNNLAQREVFLNQQIALEETTLRQKTQDNFSLRDSAIARIEQLEILIANERELLEIRESAFERKLSLHQQGYIPSVDLELTKAEYLQQKGSLQNLVLRKIELDEEQEKLHQFITNYRNESQQHLLNLESELSVLQQEVISTRFSATNTVLAPIAGEISAIIHREGDTVSPQQIVMVITPVGAVLQAELFVPSRAIGFLEEGQHTNIRFAPYPYQKFGVFTGLVKSISRTVLVPDEIHPDFNISEPVYRVNVALETQTIEAFGKIIRLRPGVLLEATIIQEERSLIEWLLEPLYSAMKAKQNV